MTLIPLNSGTRIVGSGVGTVTTAGTPVQLSAQRCKRVMIQMSETEEETKIVVGDANVDALSTPIRGRTLFATQADWFQCQDASEIYVDALLDGTKFSYLIEA